MSSHDAVSADTVVRRSHGRRSYQFYKGRNNSMARTTLRKYIIGILLVSSLDYHSSQTGVASSFQIPNQFPRHQYCQRAPYYNKVTNRRQEPRFLQKDGGTPILTLEDDITLTTDSNRRKGGERRKNQEVLTIGAQVSYTSDPKPATMSEGKTLAQFFRRHHGILLRGGYDDGDEGAYPIERLSFEDGDRTRSQRLLCIWKEQCGDMDAKLPVIDVNGDGGSDYMASVETEGISIAGVKMTPTSVIGVKILPSVEQSDADDWKEGATMPEFQGVLIKNDMRAKGPRPFVWLFNTMLYGNKNPDYDAAHKMMETASLTRVWTEYSDADEERLVFRATSFMQIQIFYPKTLSKLLPMGKGTVESLCSKLIAKALKKNLFPAMKRFHCVYQEWILPDTKHS